MRSKNPDLFSGEELAVESGEKVIKGEKERDIASMEESLKVPTRKQSIPNQCLTKPLFLRCFPILGEMIKRKMKAIDPWYGLSKRG